MTIEIPAESFAQRIAAEPVLVDPNRVAAFGACLADLIRDEHFQDFMQPAAINDDGFWPAPGDWMARYRPYNVIDGVLQIPVMGALINRMGYQIGRYATGYTYIERAFERGLADSMVKGIAFVIDSPGGEAAGNFELVDKLYAGRGQKPMAAFVADMAFSGGYSIATAAPTVNITRSGATGSVGVVTMHVDVSEALSQAGYNITFIKAGAHKVDGNSYEPLPADVEARIQTRIDKIYGVFTATVARNRNMEEGAVRATEALTYDAEESIEVGFADRIGVLEEDLSAFSHEVADTNGDVPMTETTESTEKTFTQADLDAATNAAREAAVAAERGRFAQVVEGQYYEGREALAHRLLATTDLAPEAIGNLLESTPNVKDDKTSANPFAQAMDAEDNPNVGGGDGDDAAAVSVTDRVFGHCGITEARN